MKVYRVEYKSLEDNVWKEHTYTGVEAKTFARLLASAEESSTMCITKAYIGDLNEIHENETKIDIETLVNVLL